MPRSQVASVANWDVGLPAADAEVLKFKVKQGGKLDIKFENAEGVNDADVSVLVSADGSSFSALDATNNGAVITNQAVVRKQTQEFTINMRQGQDNYLQITGSGSTRIQVQIRGDAILDAEEF